MMRNEYALILIHYLDPLAVEALIRRSECWHTPPSRIFVVDNSRDFPPSGDRPTTEVLDPSRNVGYGVAANLGMSAALEAGFEFAMIGTQDLQIENEATQILVDTLAENTDAAICGPVLAFSKNNEMVFSDGGTITRNGRTLHPNQGRQIRELPSSGIREVDWLDGAALMVRLRDVLGVGGFDSKYFLYVEEVDLQLALRNSGRRILVCYSARAAQQPGYYSLYYKYRNLLYFTAKYSDYFGVWPWYLAWVRDFPRAVLKGAPAEIAWAVRGVSDFKRGQMGQRPLRWLGKSPEGRKAVK